jgi:hypothetical protein
LETPVKGLRIPAAVLAAASIALTACTPATPGSPSTPTPQFSFGLTPLVGFTESPVAPDAPPCDYPEQIEEPDWLPDDLTFPEGTYASQRLEDSYGYKRGIFVMRTSLSAFTQHVLTEWPELGWTLGRGDSEPGEVEDQFTKPPAVGAFKAQSVYCDPGYAVMILIYAPDSSKVGVNPNTQSGSPLPGRSPTP